MLNPADPADTCWESAERPQGSRGDDWPTLKLTAPAQEPFRAGAFRVVAWRKRKRRTHGTYPWPVARDVSIATPTKIL